MSWDVYGNVGLLKNLADTQQSFHNRFQGVMNSVDSAARQTLGQWDGAGQAGFSQASVEYERLHTAVQSAFSRLIASTNESADSYGRLTHHLHGLFD
ncbi:MAG: hypothetical protein H0U15_11595 [Geodermatophilaceae bacterium]|jgi:uncharacterized protein YukE|nr:hypothetical protein [Geodermatophilaceae bacterium]